MKIVFGTLLALLVPVAGTILTDAPVIWPISVLIYNLGLLCSFAVVPKRLVRVIFYTIVAATFFIIEASFFFSYYLQNTGFNDAFFYHIRPDLLYAGVREHQSVILGIIICLLGFLVMSSSVLYYEKPQKARLAPVALGVLFLGLFISPPGKALVFYAENYSPEHKNNSALFENYRELLGPKVSIKFSNPKKPNIVLIYAESLEQRFFDETLFPDLLPGLKVIREKSIDFSNISQGPGAGWTVGGVVASQCGYPLASSHDIHGNGLNIFDEFLPRATCLGDLLNNDGYDLTFIGGADARFAGKDNFLRTHGYKEIIDRDDLQSTLADKSYQHSWGVFDDTIFDYASKKFTDLSRKSPPFLLTLLTLDPHGPKGNRSKSCEPYGSGNNSSLNSFHCSDLLISRFVRQVRNSPYSDNTIIIVLSDHLSMRNKASPLLETSQMPSRLTFFINTPDGQVAKNSNPGVHYDIAPTILDIAGYNIRGQMGFGESLTRGPGYLPGKFGEKNWRKQIPDLMAIGSTLWDNEVTLDKVGIKFRVSDLALAMGGREFTLSSRGVSSRPASTLFIFDDTTLMLEKIMSYPRDKGLTRETLSKALLEHKEKLALVISRAINLPGFSDPRINNPDQWVYFCGKPGSDFFSWGPITGDFLIPFYLIQDLRKSKLDDKVIRERENVLKYMYGGGTARSGK